MAQGIVLLLDAAANAAVRDCWQSLERAGLRSLASYTHGRHAPHISLVVAERVDVGEWLGTLGEAFFAGPPISVALGPVSAFPAGGWVYLGVDGLDRSAHSRLVASLGDDVAEPWEHYLPDVWIPHITLASGIDGDRIGEAFAVVASVLLPTPAMIEGAAVIDSESGSVDRLPVAARGA